jgi:hypothetical protein
MNKLFFILFITLVFSKVHSQDSYSKLPNEKNKCVTVIISEDIIANEKAIGTKKELISEMRVLMHKPNRKEHKFYNLT